MIIVNSPGNVTTTYAPLLHTGWNGFTLTDLVFPSFLFATGNSMSFVTEKWPQMKQQEVLKKIFKRTLLIFLLGFLLHWLPHLNDTNSQYILVTFSTVRILGVLQRIALAYCLASLLLYYFRPKLTLIIAVVLLFLYWGILILFGDKGTELTMTGNAITKFDIWLMGANHLPRAEGIPFETNGWLGTTSAMINVVAGFFVGQYIRQMGKSYDFIVKLILAGFVLFILACLWDISFPINKKLWTSSYVVYTVGFDCMIIGSIIFVMFFLNKIKWTYFFEVFGKNPLFIYISSELGAYLLYNLRVQPGKPLANWLFENVFQHTGMYFGSLLFSITFMLLCWLLGWWMDKKKVYIKV